MTSPNDIVGLVKELQNSLDVMSGVSANDQRNIKSLTKQLSIALLERDEKLKIAVEALEDSANMPEYDQDDAHRLRDKAKHALSRIRQ